MNRMYRACFWIGILGYMFLPQRTLAGTPSVCVINSFTANPATIMTGSLSSLAWNTTNCWTATLTYLGNVTPIGSISTGILSTTTLYTLTATGSNTTTATVTVTVTYPPCEITSFTANPSTIPYNTSSTLSWETINCNNAEIDLLGPVAPVNAGTESTGNLTNSTIYTLTASAGNTVTATTSVNVLAPICTMYVMGGQSVTGYKHDVWSTADGTNWTQLANAPWDKRADYASTIFNDGTGDKIYIMGGRKSNLHKLNDVWSFDGTTWTQLPNAPWSKRYAHVAVTFNDGTGDKIYVMGGKDDANITSKDVWSFNGTTWTQLPNAGWSPRLEHAAVTFNNGTGNKIYVMGGYSNSYKKDVWSFNGTTWTQLPNAPWAARGDFMPVVFNDGTGDKIYVTGGNGYFSVDDLWAYDGVAWNQIMNQSPWGKRVEPGMAVMNDGNVDKMYFMGGSSSSILQNDVWSSTSGTSWTQLPTPPWNERYDFTPMTLCQ